MFDLRMLGVMGMVFQLFIVIIGIMSVITEPPRCPDSLIHVGNLCVNVTGIPAKPDRGGWIMIIASAFMFYIYYVLFKKYAKLEDKKTLIRTSPKIHLTDSERARLVEYYRGRLERLRFGDSKSGIWIPEFRVFDIEAVLKDAGASKVEIHHEEYIAFV